MAIYKEHSKISATIEEINQYHLKSKNHLLPSHIGYCPYCHALRQNIQFHSVRFRQFYVILGTIVHIVKSFLQRFI